MLNSATHCFYLRRATSKSKGRVRSPKPRIITRGNFQSCKEQVSVPEIHAHLIPQRKREEKGPEDACAALGWEPRHGAGLAGSVSPGSHFQHLHPFTHLDCCPCKRWRGLACGSRCTATRVTAQVYITTENKLFLRLAAKAVCSSVIAAAWRVEKSAFFRVYFTFERIQQLCNNGGKVPNHSFGTLRFQVGFDMNFVAEICTFPLRHA